MNAPSWNELRKLAARAPARLVLADGDDPRAQRAAEQARREKIADPILLTHEDPSDSDRWVDALLRISKFKDLSSSEAKKKVKDPLVRGCLMLREKHVDGFIGGATRTTADTLRAVFSIVGLAPKVSTLFGLFVIQAQDGRFVLLSDCAVIPEPSPKQLAAIGLGSAKACQDFLGLKPQIAFLSFSTKGSAEHPSVDRIREAVRIAREKSPETVLEGEWQADAALDVFSAQIKGVGESPMAGSANVLVAPNLECGNIAYKLVQRLGGCRAVGPILWGTAQPANDLSRGCSAEDIVDMMAITTLQVQHQNHKENIAHA